MSATAAQETVVVDGELHRLRKGRRKGFSAEPPPETIRRPARVAIMLALAHMIQRAIDRGEIRDQAEAARRLGVTRARMTQILDLTLLAPDLQEKLLFLGITSHGEDPPSAGGLRHAISFRRWSEQRFALRRGPRI